MRLAKSLLIASAMSTLFATASLADASLVQKGEKIFKGKTKGNCVACHAVQGKQDIQDMGPGSFGPKLVGLKYWGDELLYDTVYDIYKARGLKISPMPAFGPTGWLNDAEIKAVVAYLKTIE
jgi:sulfur-oxidizing protein SoxX